MMKDTAILALLVLGKSHTRHKMPVRVGFLTPKMSVQALTAHVVWQLQPPHFLSHYFLYFSGLNWANPKKAAVLFEEFSAVNDPFFFLDESWILL